MPIGGAMFLFLYRATYGKPVPSVPFELDLVFCWFFNFQTRDIQRHTNWFTSMVRKYSSELSVPELRYHFEFEGVTNKKPLWISKGVCLSVPGRN